MDNKELNKQELKDASGGFRFYTMCVILVFLLIACVVCPLVIPDFSKQAYAVPLMITGLALPFLYFFVFGGMAIIEENKKK